METPKGLHIFYISGVNVELQASDGISQAPLGERLTEPIAGPSGRQERLNCWLKNLLMNVLSHLRMVSSSYTFAKAFCARKKIFSVE